MHNFRDITQNITVVKQVCHTYLHTNHSRCWKYPSCVVTVDTLNHSLAYPFKGSGLHPNSITGCIRALLQNYCIRNSGYTRAFRYLHCTTRGIFEVLLWFVKENKSAMLVCFTTVMFYVISRKLCIFEYIFVEIFYFFYWRESLFLILAPTFCYYLVYCQFYFCHIDVYNWMNRITNVIYCCQFHDVTELDIFLWYSFAWEIRNSNYIDGHLIFYIVL